MVEFNIGSHTVGDDNQCFIIAEIGQNHQGSIDIAKKLIKAAKESGADCVKFQKSHLEEKFTAAALQRKYDSPHSWGKTYGEHKSHLEFTHKEYIILKNYAKSINICFSASAMDQISANFLENLGIDFLKIGSGDANNFKLLNQVNNMKLPLIVSTGMQNLSTVVDIYSLLCDHPEGVCILQCTSTYPTPPSEANLRVISDYIVRFPKAVIGYSGHELGYSITLGAVALGAKIIERHITLDHTMKGSDHRCSLEPHEFKNMVQDIRIVESALGSPTKKIQPNEHLCRSKLGKSVVMVKDVPAEHVLQEEDLTIKVSEPAGWSPQNWSQLIGRITRISLQKDHPVNEKDLQI